MTLELASDNIIELGNNSGNNHDGLLFSLALFQGWRAETGKSQRYFQGRTAEKLQQDASEKWISRKPVCRNRVRLNGGS